MKNTPNLTGRQSVAQLMTNLCNGKITGNEFVDGCYDIRVRSDRNLLMVIEWLTDVFAPEFGKPAFDINRPPFWVRRQFALFRRFLLANVDYQWPAGALHHDWWPFVRLMGTAVLGCAAIVSIVLARINALAILLLFALLTAIVWILGREKDASQKDHDRAQQRARQFGEPKAWPFRTFEDFRAAGSSHRLRTAT